MPLVNANVPPVAIVKLFVINCTEVPPLLMVILLKLLAPALTVWVPDVPLKTTVLVPVVKVLVLAKFPATLRTWVVEVPMVRVPAMLMPPGPGPVIVASVELIVRVLPAIAS